jgi:hypothetical protein
MDESAEAIKLDPERERERDNTKGHCTRELCRSFVVLFRRVILKISNFSAFFLPTKNWQPTKVCKGLYATNSLLYVSPFPLFFLAIDPSGKVNHSRWKKMKEEEMFGSLECACLNLPIYKYKTILFAVLPSIWSIWKIESLKMKEENMIGSVHLNLLAWTIYNKSNYKISSFIYHPFSLFFLEARSVWKSESFKMKIKGEIFFSSESGGGWEEKTFGHNSKSLS